MKIWLIWNGEQVPEDREIIEVFSNERAAYEFVNGGECARQGYDVSTEGPDGEPSDDIECCAVCETVAESHANYVKALRAKMIRDMSVVECEAMRIEWVDGAGAEIVEVADET